MHQKYRGLRKRGLANVVKRGNGYGILTKQFDPDSGEELKPIFRPVSIPYCDNTKRHLREELADLDALIEDLKGVAE